MIGVDTANAVIVESHGKESPCVGEVCPWAIDRPTYAIIRRAVPRKFTQFMGPSLCGLGRANIGSNHRGCLRPTIFFLIKGPSLPSSLCCFPSGWLLINLLHSRAMKPLYHRHRLGYRVRQLLLFNFCCQVGEFVLSINWTYSGYQSVDHLSGSNKSLENYNEK